MHFDCKVENGLGGPRVNPGHQLGGNCNIKVRENEKDNEIQGRVLIMRLHLLPKYWLSLSL